MAPCLLPKEMCKAGQKVAGLWPLVNKAPRCLIRAQNHFSLLVFKVRSGTQLSLSAVIKASNCWDGSFQGRDEPHAPKASGRPSSPLVSGKPRLRGPWKRWAPETDYSMPFPLGQACGARCPGLGWPEQGVAGVMDCWPAAADGRGGLLLG